MFDMFKNSIVLFWKGKLFQDLGSVIRQVVIGVAITAVLCIVLAKVGLPLWAAIAVSALIGGMIQPRLFRDLKYA